jgi:hypothetical protein
MPGPTGNKGVPRPLVQGVRELNQYRNRDRRWRVYWLFRPRLGHVAGLLPYRYNLDTPLSHLALSDLSETLQIISNTKIPPSSDMFRMAL